MNQLTDTIWADLDEQIKESLCHALRIRHAYAAQPHRVTISMSNNEAKLFNACAGVSDQTTESSLLILLEDPATLEVALSSRLWPTYARSQKHCMIHLMLDIARCLNRKGEVVNLLKISKQNHVEYAPDFHNDWFAAICGELDIELCKAVLEVYPQCINARVEKIPALEWAMHLDDGEGDKLLELLLHFGAETNGRHQQFDSDHGRTLTEAVYARSRNGVNCLIYYGAILEQSGALHAAVTVGWVEGMDLLLEHGVNVSEILRGAQNEDSSLALLTNGSDSPLQHALRIKRTEAAIWLIKHGADLLYRNNNGETSYDLACEGDDRDLVRFLGSYYDKALRKNGSTELAEELFKTISTDQIDTILKYLEDGTLRDEEVSISSSADEDDRGPPRKKIRIRVRRTERDVRQ